MESKTKVTAQEGKQDLLLTREFDLPVALLFRAYVEPELVAQWMGTNVLKLDSKRHGSYQLETTDAEGNVVFKASGVIHEFVPNQKITRTFELENKPFPIQLEFLDFQKLTEETSKLSIHIVYRSVSQRDQVLLMPFVNGMSRAHDRLQTIIGELN